LFLERDLIFWVFFRSTALVRIASDPTDKEWASSVLKTTEDIVVIKDKYAKARFHVLVVPRRVAVDTVGDVTVEHLPLLKEMYQTAKEMIQARLAEEPKATFRVGFHSSPSMQYARIIGNVFPAERLQQPTFTHRDFFTIFRRLHMHVISTDFDSPALMRRPSFRRSNPRARFHTLIQVQKEKMPLSAKFHTAHFVEKRLEKVLRDYSSSRCII
jgi:hypothetical protein